jgi:hypothetical protein
MRLSLIVLLLISAQVGADDGYPQNPLVARDGTRVGLPSSKGGLTGFAASFSICEVATGACDQRLVYYDSTEAELFRPAAGAT